LPEVTGILEELKSQAPKNLSNPPKPSDDPSFQTKTDEEPFLGGCPIDLDRKLKDGRTVKQALEYEIAREVEESIQASYVQEDKIRKWNKQYQGIAEPKSDPYPGCANIFIPLTRWLTDTIVVRVFDVLFGQRKVWVFKALKPELADIVKKLEDSFDWWQKWVAHLKKTLYSPIMQSIKTGVGIIKFDYVRKKRTVVRYATEEEKKDKKLKKYRTAEGELVVKMPVTIYEGPVVRPVPREDFLISPDASSIKDARMVGMRFYLRKPEVELRIKQGYYYPEIIDKFYSPQELDDTKQERLASKGIDIRITVPDKFRMYEIWTKFDVDDDGEEDDICVVWYHQNKTICRAIYNPFFYGMRPFKDLVFYPVEYSFDGDGTCQILEQIQHEVNTQHNQRLDRMNQINAPMYIRRSDSTSTDFKIYPGKIWDVDDIETSIKELRFSDVYASTWQEESVLNSYAEKSVGVTPHVMGQPTSERPVAKDTNLLLQEANKKFKFGIENFRGDLGETGMMLLELFAQYQPVWIEVDSKTEVVQSRTLNFPLEYIRDGIAVDMAASTELLNTEVRIARNQQAYAMLSDYSNKLGGMISAVVSPNVPPAMKEYIIEVSKTGKKLMQRIFEDFDIIDASELIKEIPAELAQQTPPPMPPQGMPPQQGQMPQQGQPQGQPQRPPQRPQQRPMPQRPQGGMVR